mmetsp:Transcript_20230/g.46013  ORF Transcript_20230/g.46013 Transcript_20230/m.46013 type:complete len:177 (-) Transcript_20230:129-659(-)|eukprot:749434-Hanusia_phi.AAC.1
MTAQTVRVTARPRKDAEVPSGLPVDLDLPTIEGMFHMRQEDAAASLGISLSSLKSACRRLGVRRWPYSRLHGTNMEQEEAEQEREVTPAANSTDEHDTGQASAEQGSSQNTTYASLDEAVFRSTTWPRLEHTEPRWLECRELTEAHCEVDWVCHFSKESVRWLKHFLSSNDEYMSD